MSRREDLTPDEVGEITLSGLVDAADYCALRLRPLSTGLLIEGLPDGSHAFTQPVHLDKGTMLWQAHSGLVDATGAASVSLQPGDIISIEMRLIVRREALTPPGAIELPPLPTLTPLEAQ